MSNLAAKIPSSEKRFSEYMNQTKEIIPINDLTIKGTRMHLTH